MIDVITTKDLSPKEDKEKEQNKEGEVNGD